MALAFALDRIEMWPLVRLQPNAKNAKVHGDEQAARIAATWPGSAGPCPTSWPRTAN